MENDKKFLIVFLMAIFCISCATEANSNNVDYRAVFNSMLTSEDIGSDGFKLYWVKGNTIVIKESKSTLANQDCVVYEISSPDNENSDYVSPFFSLYALYYDFPNGFEESEITKSILSGILANGTKSNQGQDVEIVAYNDYRKDGLNLIDVTFSAPLQLGFYERQETVITDFEGDILVLNINYLYSDSYRDDYIMALYLSTTNTLQSTEWL